MTTIQINTPADTDATVNPSYEIIDGRRVADVDAEAAREFSQEQMWSLENIWAC